MTISPDDPQTASIVTAIQQGEVDSLRRLLQDRPELATARIGDGPKARTLLHTVADWPGHLPNGAAAVGVLVGAGADVNAVFVGRNTQSAETPLHWAASSDDVEVLDALIDAGADIEVPGAVIAGGTPLADAVAFGQWKAARRLVERGARTTLWQAAALGLVTRVQELLDQAPSSHDITNALWHASQGGQQETATMLIDRGADISWVGYDGLTPLGAAERAGADGVAERLRQRGAH